MTGPSSHDPKATWGDPNGKGGVRIVAGRAALIVVIAVVLGVLLLNVGTRPPAGLSANLTVPTTVTTPSTGTTVTTGGHSGRSSATTTTAPPVVKANVKVLVANASTVNGVAHTYAAELQRDGWGILTPVTANVTTATSAVYYSAGEQDAAAEVAAELAIPSSAVSALTAAVPVSGTTGASLVVVIGSDLATKATSSTTTTASKA